MATEAVAERQRAAHLGPERRRPLVLDAAMEVDRGREWSLTKLFVRVDGGKARFRRRGETKVVDWDAVVGLGLTEHGQGAASLLATFEQLRPADLATVLHELSPKRRLEVASALDDEKLASSYMRPSFSCSSARSSSIFSASISLFVSPDLKVRCDPPMPR